METVDPPISREVSLQPCMTGNNSSFLEFYSKCGRRRNLNKDQIGCGSMLVEWPSVGGAAVRVEAWVERQGGVPLNWQGQDGNL